MNNNKKLNILFFTKGDRVTGSSRQRVWNVADKLYQKYGVQYDIVHGVGYNLFSLNPQRFFVLIGVIKKLFDKKYSIFFVHKSIFPLDVVLSIIAVSKLRKVPVVYDLDDAEWAHSGLKTRLLAKNAKVVLCGSARIKEKMEEYTNKTFLVPTVIDFDIYKKHAIEHKNKDVINIGWEGYGPGYVRNEHFKILKEALNTLRSTGYKFNFIFIGAKGSRDVYDYFSDISEHMEIIDELEWDKEGAVPAALRKYEIDIGVAPINEDSFSKAKCAFKIIEYMAVGLPVIVSPVGEQTIVARDKVDGFHARTVEEWVAAFKKLANEKNRVKMGKSGMEKVSSKYTYEAIIPIIAELIFKQ